MAVLQASATVEVWSWDEAFLGQHRRSSVTDRCETKVAAVTGLSCGRHQRDSAAGKTATGFASRVVLPG
jgi:hypothetical protein